MYTHNVIEEGRARYAAMEKDAGLVVAVLALTSTIVIFLLRPTLWFTLGSLLAGFIAFLTWRASLSGKFGLAAFLAIAFALAFLLAAATEFNRPAPELLGMGISLLGLGMYAAVLLAKLGRRA